MSKKFPKKRFVVDTNYLARPELRDWLAESGLHCAVLTEFAAMESYKGDTLKTLFPNMAVLIEFPRQVIVLKGAELTHGLIDRVSNPQLRLLDQEQTAAFVQFADHVQNPTPYVEKQMVGLGGHADVTMEKMVGEATKIAQVIPELLSIYDEKEQRILRTQAELPRDLAHKVMDQVMALAAFLLKSAKVKRAPTFDELVDTLIFREALCIYIWTIRTLKGTSPTNAAKIRNTMVDCTFAAYATFFDGLWTAESLPMEIYQAAIGWLRSIREAV